MRVRNLGILIPYESVEGERHMIRFRFRGELDRRQARKLIRRSLTPLGIIVSNQLLNFYIKHRSYDLGLDEA
jgi:hypothetical protein